MTPPPSRRATVLAAPVLACLLLAACDERDATAPATSPSHPASKPATAVLKDVLDTAPTHVIGISYPQGLAAYPGLAAIAQRYATTAREQVLDAVHERPRRAGDAPYELSLDFRLLHASPTLAVLAVDGSSYTGGVHGMPMIARWTWLPATSHVLTVGELFPKPDTWTRVSGEVRRQLRVEAERRLDDVAPRDQASALASMMSMIDGGTEPTPDDFDLFEPLLDGAGRIVALRFVFPPYQAGAYADGVRTVELPMATLLPEVAPRYRALFAAGAE